MENRENLFFYPYHSWFDQAAKETGCQPKSSDSLNLYTLKNIVCFVTDLQSEVVSAFVSAL